MSYLPTDDKARKNLPIWKMVTGYFPKALREITRVCVANNVRYNPGSDPADISWARGKSKDQLGSSFRHMMEAVVDGKVFEDEVSPVDGKPLYILAENAWRACAALEQAIEEQEAKKPGALGQVTYPCYSGPIEKRCDRNGPGGFMGHTCGQNKAAVVPTGTSVRTRDYSRDLDVLASPYPPGVESNPYG